MACFYLLRTKIPPLCSILVWREGARLSIYTQGPANHWVALKMACLFKLIL